MINAYFLIGILVYWTIGLGISLLLHVYWHDMNSKKKIMFDENDIQTDSESKMLINNSIASSKQNWIMTLLLISFFWLPLAFSQIVMRKTN